jgi:hypothetical protein
MKSRLNTSGQSPYGGNASAIPATSRARPSEGRVLPERQRFSLTTLVFNG